MSSNPSATEDPPYGGDEACLLLTIPNDPINYGRGIVAFAAPYLAQPLKIYPAFPTGGFSHSMGTEAATQNLYINDFDSLKVFILSCLENAGSSCIPFVRAAYENADNLQKVMLLDSLHNATLLNHVAHRASKLQGKSFLTTSCKVFQLPVTEKLKDLADDEKIHCHLISYFLRNRLHEIQFHARVAATGVVVLTAEHRARRLAWCHCHRIECHRELFMDESRFCLWSNDSRPRVWRPPGERYAPTRFAERQTDPTPGIMVWSLISHRMPLVLIDGRLTADRYVTQVVEPVVLPLLQGAPNTVFQQDIVTQ
ncbi:urease accessory protein F [Trichonephila clavipes]|nr:urease accessory protein F [Trichonephila clavipes]